MPFFKQSDEPPASRKSLRRQGKASPCVYCLAASSVFVKRQNLSTSCFPCAAEKLTTMWCSFSRRSRSVPPLHKAARPGTRDCVSRCSVALHTASHRLAERNRYVALRSLFMSGLDAPVSPCLQFRLRRFKPSLPSPSVSSSLPAPTCSASTSGSDCPPPARLTRAKVSMSVLLFNCMYKLPCTILPRFSRIKTGACRGLRPCLLCHLRPATATAVAVAASGPKQHRSSDERPLQPQCEIQRHHPPEGRCWGYIYLFFGRSRAYARLLSYVIH